MPQQYRSPSAIRNWHAHVYFDEGTRAQALTLRSGIEAQLAGRVVVGAVHDKPVGPHPMWSYQLGISTADFPRVLSWLTLNRGALDVFVHPNTGDPLVDHRDAAVWLGRSHELNLATLAPKPAAA